MRPAQRFWAAAPSAGVTAIKPDPTSTNSNEATPVILNNVNPFGPPPRFSPEERKCQSRPIHAQSSMSANSEEHADHCSGAVDSFPPSCLAEMVEVTSIRKVRIGPFVSDHAEPRLNRLLGRRRPREFRNVGKTPNGTVPRR